VLARASSEARAGAGSPRRRGGRGRLLLGENARRIKIISLRSWQLAVATSLCEQERKEHELLEGRYCRLEAEHTASLQEAARRQRAATELLRQHAHLAQSQAMCHAEAVEAMRAKSTKLEDFVNNFRKEFILRAQWVWKAWELHVAVQKCRGSCSLLQSTLIEFQRAADNELMLVLMWQHWKLTLRENRFAADNEVLAQRVKHLNGILESQVCRFNDVSEQREMERQDMICLLERVEEREQLNEERLLAVERKNVALKKEPSKANMDADRIEGAGAGHDRVVRSIGVQHDERSSREISTQCTQTFDVGCQQCGAEDTREHGDGRDTLLRGELVIGRYTWSGREVSIQVDGMVSTPCQTEWAEQQACHQDPTPSHNDEHHPDHGMAKLADSDLGEKLMTDDGMIDSDHLFDLRKFLLGAKAAVLKANEELLVTWAEGRRRSLEFIDVCMDSQRRQEDRHLQLLVMLQFKRHQTRCQLIRWLDMSAGKNSDLTLVRSLRLWADHTRNKKHNYKIAHGLSCLLDLDLVRSSFCFWHLRSQRQGQKELLTLYFPDAPWPAPPCFKAELIAALVSLGASGMDDVEVRLREGSIAADLAGPADALEEIRGLLHGLGGDVLTVLGYKVADVWSSPDKHVDLSRSSQLEEPPANTVPAQLQLPLGEAAQGLTPASPVFPGSIESDSPHSSPRHPPSPVPVPSSAPSLDDIAEETETNSEAPSLAGSQGREQPPRHGSVAFPDELAEVCDPSDGGESPPSNRALQEATNFHLPRTHSAPNLGAATAPGPRSSGNSQTRLAATAGPLAPPDETLPPARRRGSQAGSEQLEGEEEYRSPYFRRRLSQLQNVSAAQGTETSKQKLDRVLREKVAEHLGDATDFACLSKDKYRIAGQQAIVSLKGGQVIVRQGAQWIPLATFLQKIKPPEARFDTGAVAAAAPMTRANVAAVAAAAPGAAACSCGALMKPTDRFCASCGMTRIEWTPQETLCTCGAVVPGTALFCVSCGKPNHTGQAAAAFICPPPDGGSRAGSPAVSPHSSVAVSPRSSVRAGGGSSLGGYPSRPASLPKAGAGAGKAPPRGPALGRASSNPQPKAAVPKGLRNPGTAPGRNLAPAIPPGANRARARG